MARVEYRIVQHDGGWTYKVGDVFAETFPTREEAEAAAKRAAEEQRKPPAPHTIEFEDEKGEWHVERSEREPPEIEVR